MNIELLTSKSDPLLKIESLHKQFRVGGPLSSGWLQAVRDVSFTLDRGSVLALVGESGSGKSTVARMITRLITPTSGRVLLSGIDLEDKASRRNVEEYRRKIQMVFQDPFSSLNPVHTIGHHLSRPVILHHQSLSKRETREKVYELLSTVGLNPPEEVANKHPHELSGGQRQRVALARALAVQPEIVLADEPVSMLDVSIRIDILNLMERLKNEHDLSYLYITHDLASARYIAQFITVMYAGYAIENGPSESLLKEPAHPYTRRLISAVPNLASIVPSHSSKVQRSKPPQLVNPPPGCPYAERCPLVMPVCREAMPDITWIDSNRWVRCFAHGNVRNQPAPSN